MTRTMPTLVLDLDDTLLKTDLLFEQAFRYLKKHPFETPKIAWLTRQGYLVVKRYLAERLELDPSLLPYRAQILDIAKKHRERGGKVALASASPDEWVQTIAKHLNEKLKGELGGVALFEFAFGSKEVNLRGIEKLKALKRHLEPHEAFIYAGDSDSDLDIWNEAHGAIGVNVTPATATTLKAWINQGKLQEVDEIYDRKPKSEMVFLACRPSSWLKNLLVAAPFLFFSAQNALPKIPLAGARVSIAVLSFLLASCSAYVFNDLLDVDEDRRHKSKHKRPFASGELHLTTGMSLSPFFALVSLALSLFLPLRFSMVIIAYLALNIVYCVFFRHFRVARFGFMGFTLFLRLLAGWTLIASSLMF